MTTPEVTRLLHSAADGDEAAREELYSIVYAELRRVARGQLRRGARGEVQTTTLVHGAYLKMFDGARLQVRDRSHFFALSARVMRQVLVDHFRRSSAERRGGAESPVTLQDALVAGPITGQVVLAVHDALEQLAELSPRLAQVVEYKFFGGLTQQEIGEILGVTERTVRSDWRAAKTWLAHHMQQDSP